VILSRLWARTWRAPRRARLLYATMTLAFGALAGAGAVSGDVAVATIAGLVALATAALAFLAPRLATLTGNRSEREVE
jgi:succinate-acetate transporter protein